MEKFSLEAQKVITLAESLSFSYGHNLIGREHVLLSLLKRDDYFTSELKKYGITFETTSKRIKNLYPKSDDNLLFMEYTMGLKKYLEKAQTYSLSHNEDAISILTLETVLLLESEGIVFEWFQKHKVNTTNLAQSLSVVSKKKSDLDNVIDLTNLNNLQSDPLIGRENELNQLINALSRRNKPNAILVGEPGVGKTAIVEQLARMIKEGNIPALRNKTIYELDLASTVSGTKYRGEFEDKLKKIIKKVKDDGNAILFIDEIHNIVRAGGAEGAIDASNILKPYLTRGEIKIIGATTEEEFLESFEKDKALKRRFQIIKVNPATVTETKQILEGIKDIYEKYYDTIIHEQELDFIIKMANQYLPSYFFPDKAIEILDNSLVIADKVLTEQDIIKTMDRLYKVKVNLDDKAKVVTDCLKKELSSQNDVIEQIEANLKMIEYGLIEDKKPLSVMLFLGPSGVGKTKAAKIIGEKYFDNPEAVITLDMAAYQDATSISKLCGGNPGYTGYDNYSYFVKSLKKNPHSLIILDEIEKAHNEVLDFFLGIFDQGYFYDTKGVKINCNNAIFVLTSNYGYDQKRVMSANLKKGGIQKEAILQKLSERFRQEFLSRIDDIILFNYLNLSDKPMIVNNYLKSLKMQTQLELDSDLIVMDEDEFQKHGARAIQKMTKKVLLNQQKVK